MIFWTVFIVHSVRHSGGVHDGGVYDHSAGLDGAGHGFVHGVCLCHDIGGKYEFEDDELVDVLLLVILIITVYTPAHKITLICSHDTDRRVQTAHDIGV